MIGNALKVVLPSDGTIRTAAEMHAVLLAACNGEGDILVDASAVERADLTFLQVILSAQSICDAQGRKLSFCAVPECIQTLFERAGVPSISLTASGS